jgi:predicted RNA methylase
MTLDLFGTPEQHASASQWFTPPWLARRMAAWIAPHARVLEPSCGSGNLLDALLRRGHPAEQLLGVELDESWANYAEARFGGKVHVEHGNFLTNAWTRHTCASFRADVVMMNPPFEGNAHMDFVIRALEVAHEVIGVFPSSFEFSQERDRELWATKACVTRRARLPERVDYGGETSGKFDSVVLRIIARRNGSRRVGEVLDVREEVWLRESV